MTELLKSKTERRKLPRLNVTSEQFKLMPSGKVFSIVDLSNDGMSIHVLDKEDFRVFQIAARCQGKIKVGAQKYEITATVRNIRDQLVGFSFDDLSAEVKTALERFLAPEHLGSELHPMPSGEKQGFSMLWYHGVSGTDLHFWRNEQGEIKKFTLYVQAMYVGWDLSQGISTGRMEPSREKSENSGLYRYDTVLLHIDSEPQTSKLHIAKRLIDHSPLPDDLKSWTSTQLQCN